MDSKKYNIIALANTIVAISNHINEVNFESYGRNSLCYKVGLDPILRSLSPVSRKSFWVYLGPYDYKRTFYNFRELK